MEGQVCSGITVRTSDGVRLHVQEHGAGPVTVVLLHGWTLDHRLWTRQIADLPGRVDGGVRVLAVDLRGHGRSEGGAHHETTLARLADDLWSVLRKCAPDGPVILAGHSLGGMAIMEFAHRFPEEFGRRVVGVSLISTSAEGAAHTSYGLNPLLSRLVRQIEVGGAAILARGGGWRPHRQLMPALSPAVRWLVFGDRVDMATVKLTLSMISNASLRSIGGFRPCVGRMNRIAALRALSRVPVTLLVGERDRLTPVKCTEAMTAALPQAERRVLRGCGHMLPMECPDAVTGALADLCATASR